MTQAIIKKEKWKNKTVVTARDEKDKLLAWTVHDKKISLRSRKIKFNRDNTFNKDEHHHTLTKVVEITDYKDNPKITSDYFQYIITAKLRKSQYGKPLIISARSGQFPKGTKISIAKEEAEEIYYHRLSQALGFGYDDADVITQLVENESDFVISRKEGIVWYRER